MGRNFGQPDSLASSLLSFFSLSCPQLINEVSDASRMKESGERGEAKGQGMFHSAGAVVSGTGVRGAQEVCKAASFSPGLLS